MVIAVDFDGTIVEHRYPEIGEERQNAISTLRRLQSDGHQLILWSVREGALLDEAVEWCRERGLTFYAVNTVIPEGMPEEEQRHVLISRKVNADVFIDDKNIGGLPSWNSIYDLITQTSIPTKVIKKTSKSTPTDDDNLQLPYPAWMFWKKNRK